MPWDAQSFQSHNHSLHGDRAAHAARIANATLRSGVPEGESIAIANKWAERHRDSGGGIAADPTQQVGGFAPSNATQTPLVQNLIQRYANYPPEKLQELSIMLKGSPQGQIVNRLLNQRRAMPNQTPQAPQAPVAPNFNPAQIATGQARGGQTPRLAGGGPTGVPLSQADPWWTKSEAYNSNRPSFFLQGATPGRADAVHTTAPAGAHIIPADVVAGLGEGNSLAGAGAVDQMLRSGPHGIAPMPQRGHLGVPRPPTGNPAKFESRGGATKGTPVALSHGESMVFPHWVAHIGGGDEAKGHRILDHFIVEERKRQIKKLTKLPGPVKEAA